MFEPNLKNDYLFEKKGDMVSRAKWKEHFIDCIQEAVPFNIMCQTEMGIFVVGEEGELHLIPVVGEEVKSSVVLFLDVC